MLHRTYASRGNSWRWPAALGGDTPRHGIAVDDLILVGGQNALDRGGTVQAPGDVLAQTEIVMRAIASVIGDLGGRIDNLLKLTVFYVYGGAELELTLLRRLRALVAGTPPALSLVPLPRLALPGLAITIDAVAAAGAGVAERIVAPVAPFPWPQDAAFSHAVRYGARVFVSGQMARDASGALVAKSDIVGQARATIASIDRVLRSVGCDLDDVVKLNTWYTGDGTDADWRKAAEIRANAFRFPGPGATGVPVPGPFPDGVMLRQECMALRSTAGDRLPRSLSWPLGHWDWPIPVSFQQGVKIGPLIVLGGQISTDTECKAVDPGDMRAQTHNVMRSIQNILLGFGADLDAVIKLTCFYKTRGDSADLAAMLETCTGYFAEPLPPMTIVPLENLGFEDVTLEIEGLAFVER